MPHYESIPGNKISINGIEINLDSADNFARFKDSQTEDLYYMVKSLGFLETYNEIRHCPLFPRKTGLNLLEIGLFRGGSAVFFDNYFKPKKLVAVDLTTDPPPALEAYRRKVGPRLKTIYGVDQSDKAKMRDIVKSEFDGPLDLVIDDASHFYDQTRASFEAIFPLVKPGGIYSIEDWSWAHDPSANAQDHMWAHMSALSNLAFRLVALAGSDSAIVPRLAFTAGAMWVQRGDAQLDSETFSLERYEKPRGRDLPLI